jgi:serine/threonine protein phosphatase PrpC
MTENTLPLEVASVTDRGLNERRPHNEDFMLADPAGGLFIVADGVGGAEAGEVASQTTVEIIDAAFRHRRDDDDVEDLLEIAIQRANDSVYRQSREQPHLSMMATTVVALHLDGTQATVGHVGDSRLYRLTPAGQIFRETEDHSVVEEEVRAGRMTAAQAANHPSRNVISRAVGAEPAVEVDLRAFDFEPGTIFVLCSDGITRHIPDEEIASIVSDAPTLEDACAELKRRCFERGAEDNLTAVLVRAGGAPASARPPESTAAADDEPTLIQQRNVAAGGPAAAATSAAASILRRPFDDADRQNPQPVRSAVRRAERPAPTTEAGHSADDGRAKNKPGGALVTVAVIVLLAVCASAAFVGGMLFERRSANRQAAAPAADEGQPAGAVPAPAAADDEARERSFEERKLAVDRSPREAAERMLADANNDPLSATDPEYLYLYGRALLLEDRPADAARMFDRAVSTVGMNMTPRNGQLKIDARLAMIAAHLRAGDAQAASAAADALGDVLRTERSSPPPAAGANAPPAPVVSP